MLNNLITKITYKLRKQEEVMHSLEKIENEDRVFVYEPNGVEINPKYIKPEEFQQLQNFEKFVKVHEELSDEEIFKFIKKGNKIFINEIMDAVPNFIDELRNNGAKAVALIYISDKLYSKKEDKKEEKVHFCVK